MALAVHALILLAAFPFDGSGQIVIHEAGGVPIEFALATGYGHESCVPLIAVTVEQETTLADASEYGVRTRVKGQLTLIKHRWYAVVDEIEFQEEKKL